MPGHFYGGFLAATVLRAAGLESTAARPAGMSCQFLRPCIIGGDLDISVSSLHQGRANDLLRVTIAQGDKCCIEAHVRSVQPSIGLAFEPEHKPQDLDPSSLPLLSETIERLGASPPPYTRNLEYRASADDDDRRTTDGTRGLNGWMRHGTGMIYDDAFLEAARFLVPLDTHAAAALYRANSLEALDQRQALGAGPKSIGTSLDCFVHFHRPAGTEWLHYEAHAPVATGGLASGQARLWSSDGQLLATAVSQVAFISTG